MTRPTELPPSVTYHEPTGRVTGEMYTYVDHQGGTSRVVIFENGEITAIDAFDQETGDQLPRAEYFTAPVLAWFALRAVIVSGQHAEDVLLVIDRLARHCPAPLDRLARGPALGYVSAEATQVVDAHANPWSTPPTTTSVSVPASGPGSNTGHGHVWSRPDGSRARCGGPRLCPKCAEDYATYGRPGE